jgi:cobyrinic acid a,c-diamide synthase
MMGRDGVLDTFRRATTDVDVALVEGVMGLFDGAEPTSDLASTAQLAKWLDAPVVAVVDASGMARTVGALAEGLAGYDPALRVAGLVCNHVGSRGHLALLRSTEPLRVPVMGGLPDHPATTFPERHLGLVTAQSGGIPEETFDGLAGLAEDWLGVDALLALARTAGVVPEIDATNRATARRTPARIGVARDAAFHFYYEDNLARLEAAGATLVPFSPVEDAALPAVDGLYLGGGYPEVHAAALAANTPMRRAIYGFAEQGRPVYAECGGLMYLCRVLHAGGAAHPMVGVLDAEVVMHDRLQALGYVEVETTRPTLLGATGVRFRGHQFRYSELRRGETLAEVFRVHRRRDRASFPEGFAWRNVLATYVHVHWASNPLLPRAFVEACVRARGGAPA